MKYLSVAGFLLASHLTLNAITFNFVFDSDPAPGIQPPLAGTGSFTFAADPGDGTFPFAALGAFSMMFSLGPAPEVFTEADLVTFLDVATVVLSTTGSDRRLQFSDLGFGAGLFGGALDFINPEGSALSFEPSYFGAGLRLYLIDSPEAQIFGDYLATHGVPEGGSTALLAGLGVLAFGWARRWHGRTAEFC